jgi:hypothetical protein
MGKHLPIPPTCPFLCKEKKWLHAKAWGKATNAQRTKEIGQWKCCNSNGTDNEWDSR